MLFRSNTIRQLCDRCVVLDKGKVIYEGDVDRAISVYMKENVDSRISYDYTDVERSPNESRKIQLLGLDILERDANLISQNEDLKFVLHCYANKDFNEIKLRFEIFYLDGTIVGTVFSDKKLSESKGTIFDIYMKMSMKNLAVGKYRCVALAYEYDKYGNQVGSDRVDPALSFEVIDETKENLVWLHQYWGHVRFDNMITTGIKYKNEIEGEQ